MTDELPDLTPPRLEFVKGLLAGKTASDAYRGAYDTSNWSDNAVWVQASNLKRDPKVGLWLKAAKQQALTERSYGLQEHLADLEKTRDLCAKNGAWGAVAKITELLGRASGVYVERIQTDASEQDIVKLLMSLGQPGRELAASLGVELPSDDGTSVTKH